MSDLPSDATPYLPLKQKAPEGHLYIQPGPSDSRSPCPALNTLANHGYIRRSGKDIGFFELIDALRNVYNISWPLALFLTFVGFLISAKVTFPTRSRDPSQPDTWFTLMFMPLPRWSLELESLSIRGPRKIAHDASFVHPNYIPSYAPDRQLLAEFLLFASSCRHQSQVSGLSLADMARYRVKREGELSSPLDGFHRQIALGECAIAWSVLRRRASINRKEPEDITSSEEEDVVATDTLQEWFGEERLPDGWWVDGGLRPAEPIGLFEVRQRAHDVAKIIEGYKQ